ncbi:TPA_asm: FtsK [Physarum slime mold MELD virus]|nr:TPA_asm: FtsK [Physarum slime mold MELD virus]
MVIKDKKINNQQIEVIPTNDPPPERIHGYDVVPKLYGNVFMCAKKGSGKTNVVWHILKNCADKDLYVYIFSGTVHNDSNWEHIAKELTRRGIGYEMHLDTSELLQIIDSLRVDTPDDANGKTDLPEIFRKFVDIKIKKKNEKIICITCYFFVFDDMSEELKSRRIKTLIKQHRHYKSKVIVSSHYPNDLEPGCQKQGDMWILFAGHGGDKLEMMRQAMSLGKEIDEKKFNEIYDHATAAPYSFLNVVPVKNRFMQNFNTELIIRYVSS